MKTFLKYFLLCTLCQIFSGAFAHEPVVPKVNSSVLFTENLGQWEPQVLFMADIAGGRVFCEKDKLTFVFCDTKDFHDRFLHRDKSQRLAIDCHSYDVRFENASAEKIVGENKQQEYRNYFLGNDPSRWKGGAAVFEKVHYQNVFPGIDLVLYGQGMNLKYDLVVAPGANPEQIKLGYRGVDVRTTESGAIEIPLSFTMIRESKPFSYQENKKEVKSNYRVDDNQVSFSFPEGYDPKKEMVIDPTLIFSTFTGSTGDNFGYTATYDTSGALYAGGIVFGAGYPTTIGAFQTVFGGGGLGGAWTFSGGVDISLTKFNATGTAIVWSGYLGGNGNEQPHSLITTPAGELIVMGVSWSGNYPTTPGAYNTVLGGLGDIILTKFNAAGTALIASTFVGGAGEDGMNVSPVFAPNTLKFNYGDDARGEVMLDATNNIYVASCSQSANFPTTPGCFQPANAGLQDAVVFKLGPSLSALQWSTYLGGAQNDAAYGLRVDVAGNVFAIGGTVSANFPTTPGSLQPVFGGVLDGFITQINPTGTALNASTFLGTTLYDQCYFLDLDNAGDIYVVGQTLGNWPVTPGVYSNPNSKQFIQKINPALNSTYFSTVFGTGGVSCDLSPSAFLVDICGYIYFSGWGSTIGGWSGNAGTTLGLPITPNAFQNTTDGNDFYLMVMKPNASGLEFATYFGGPVSREHVDGGTSRFNKNLQVYQSVCAGCGGNDDFPYTPGAVSQTNNSFNCNLGAFKCQLDAQNIVANFNSSQASGCSPFPVSFNNLSQGGLSFFWDFGDGSTDTAASPVHVYLFPGTYIAKLVITDTNACNPADSIIRQVIVYGQPVANVFGDSFFCAGNPVQLHASGGAHYQWYPSTGLSNDTIPNPVATPLSSTTYSVVVTSQNGCSDTGYVTINLSPFPADAGVDPYFCEGGAGGQLQATALGGTAPYYYVWWCDTTNTYCGLDSVYDDDPIAIPTVTTTYYVQITDANGCRSTVDSVVVHVLINPVVDAGPDVFICHQPGPGAFINAAVLNPAQAPGPYIYRWRPGAGLNDSTLINPYARPDTTTIYTLLVTSSNGCTSIPTTVDTFSSVTVNVKPLPIADAGPDQDICFLDSTQFPGQGYNAGPLYSYEWSPAYGLSDSSAPSPYASPALTTIYILTVWSNGCPSYGDTMTLNVHTNPTVDAGPDHDICLGESVTLPAIAWGDPLSNQYNYFWWPGDGLGSGQFLQTPFASPDSTKTYFVIATSAFGCVSEPDSARVVVKPTPIANAGLDFRVCWGDSFLLNGIFSYTTTEPVADTNQIFYSWDPPIGLSNPNYRITKGLLTTSQVYTLSVTYTNCTTRDEVIVIQYPDLDANISPDTINFCEGDSVQLLVSGGVFNPNYSWIPAISLSDSTSGNPWASPGDSVTYHLMLEEGGCRDSATVTLNVIPHPVAAFIHSTAEICEGDEVNFLETSANDWNWIWHFGDNSAVSNQPNPTHIYNFPGNYWVWMIATGPGNCADTAEASLIQVNNRTEIQIHSVPAAPCELVLPNSTVLFFQDNTPTQTSIWHFSDGTSIEKINTDHLFSQPGIYFASLTVATPEGCLSQDTLGPYVVVAPEFFIPNIFSPNADGVDDEFLIPYSGNQPYSLTILDRWGAVLFVSENKTMGWNGKSLQGTDVQEGVYYYVSNIGNKEFAGAFTLVR